MKRAVVIEPDGNVRPLPIPDPPPSEASVIHATVGGYLQLIPHDIPNISVFCDEDGKLKGKPINCLADALFGRLLGPTNRIVGTIVVMGPMDEDGETLGLTIEQVDIFLRAEPNLLDQLING